MRVTLAGRVEFHGDDGVVGGANLGAPARITAAYLVSERARPVSRDELAEIIWGEDLPDSWKQLVRAAIAQVRVALREVGVSPRDAITTAFSCYQLHLVPDAEIDIERSALDAAEAESAVATQDFDAARVRAAAAARVAARGFLPGQGGVWVEAAQRRLREVHLRALETLATACHGLGDNGAAIDAAESALAVESYRESLYQVLMRAQLAAGNPAEALRTFERCRVQLREELGISPSAATEAIYLEALNADDSVDAALPVAPLVVDSVPAPLATLASTPLIGRHHELSALLAAVAEDRPSPAVALIGGEPGIGKTRLVAEVAATLAAGGARVLFGACTPHGGAYEPLARMVADLGLGSTHGLESREQVFDTYIDTLHAFAASRTLVLTIDDLQWASTTTLALLRRMMRSVTDGRLIILATFRDGRADLSDELVELLGDVARTPSLTRVTVTGLDVDAMTELIRAEGTADVRQRAVVLAPPLLEATKGNPFFSSEVIAHWNRGSFGLPPAVVDAVRAQLMLVPEPARDLLAVAAVVGREFDVWSLEQLTEFDDGSIVDALEQAASCGLITELRDQPDRWSFAHDLVREALAEELSGARRARLHTRLGLALASKGDDAAPAIAHHLLNGTSDHRLDAVRWLIRAAEQDVADFAFESAVESYERALAEVDGRPDIDDDTRLALLVGCGVALRRAESPKRSRSVLLAASDLARELDRSAEMAEIAVALASTTTPRASGRPSELITNLLAEALGRLPIGTTQIRAKVMAHLAMQRYLAGDDDAGLALVEDAMVAARELGDPAVDLVVRAARAGESLDPVENVQRAHEWLEAAQSSLDVDHETWARINLVWANTAAARLDEARVEADAYEERVRSLRRPSLLWWATLWEASRATTEGRFGDASTLIDEATAIGAELDRSTVGTQLWTLRLALQRLTDGVSDRTVAEIDDARGGPTSPNLAALSGYARWHGSQREQVAAEFRSCTRATTVDPREGNRIAYTSLLAEMVAGTDVEPVVIDGLYEWLSSYTGKYVVVGFCGAVFGSVDRVLGLLAGAAGRPEVAARHLDDAIASFERNGARPWVSLTTEERRHLA